MELTSLQKEEISEHIHANSEHKCICPMCHKDDWQVADKTIQIQIAGKEISSAGILCSNCGFLMYHKIHEY